jgi:uncharacterized protein (UPF0276 family)
MNRYPMTKSGAGFGLGLRTPHYQDFLQGSPSAQRVDWLEIVTDNFLVDGGKPLVVLEQIRRDYSIAMHGVAMSIGASEGIDLTYVDRVKALADRVEPMWISDHLCWIGHGKNQLHDLYPLPYTDEAAQHVIAQIRRVQDRLQRRLVLENVSSYIQFRDSARAEWEFLSYIATQADCLLLLDVNNVYVSSVNHAFNPLEYLDALPADRVQQIHLAGHSNQGAHIIDTHDHPVADAVWALYRAACERFGAVATMIERDDHIPALGELVSELDRARDTCADVMRGGTRGNHHARGTQMAYAEESGDAIQTQARPRASLAVTQQRFADYVLNRSEPPPLSLLRSPHDADATSRAAIYANAYQARLSEVLGDTFGKTLLYMGSDLFDHHARAYALAHPPQTRSLSRYGDRFVDHLRAQYPGSPELIELATLDFTLRTRFDSHDAPAMSALDAAADTSAAWLTRRSVLHPGVMLIAVSTNVVQLWHAIDGDVDVPPATLLPTGATLLIWRQELQPHFRTLDADEAAFLQALHDGCAIAEAADQFAGAGRLADPNQLAEWLQMWWQDGLLAAPLRWDADAGVAPPDAPIGMAFSWNAH